MEKDLRISAIHQNPTETKCSIDFDETKLVAAHGAVAETDRN